MFFFCRGIYNLCTEIHPFIYPYLWFLYLSTTNRKYKCLIKFSMLNYTRLHTYHTHTRMHTFHIHISKTKCWTKIETHSLDVIFVPKGLTGQTVCWRCLARGGWIGRLLYWRVVCQSTSLYCTQCIRCTPWTYTWGNKSSHEILS